MQQKEKRILWSRIIYCLSLPPPRRYYPSWYRSHHHSGPPTSIFFLRVIDIWWKRGVLWNKYEIRLENAYIGPSSKLTSWPLVEVLVPRVDRTDLLEGDGKSDEMSDKARNAPSHVHIESCMEDILKKYTIDIMCSEAIQFPKEWLKESFKTSHRKDLLTPVSHQLAAKRATNVFHCMETSCEHERPSDRLVKQSVNLVK